MNKRDAAFLNFNYPLVIGQEVCHQLMADVRKKIWLIMNNIYIDQGSAEDPEESEGSRFSNSDNANAPTGIWGDTSQAGWWGRNGDFRGGTAFADYGTTGLNTTLRRGPDYINVWHNEAWGNSKGGAGTSDYDIKGATIDYTASSGHEIWVEDVEFNTYAVGKETVGGNLLKGCPLEISGANSNMDGFWRIKSVRTQTVSTVDYILITLEDLHADNDLILSQDYGGPDGSSYTEGGDTECDFGGDWYMWCPRLGNPTGNITFASDAQMIHIATANARTDGEKRPPDGGILSADESGYWCRTVNPYIYHHYDANAHRWIGFAQRRDSINYFTVLESWRMLPIDTDPKEQVPPYWTVDKEMTEYRIGGNKIEVRREHFTDWSTMLASQGSQTHFKSSPPNTFTMDRTTPRIHWASTEQYAWGRFPVMSDDSKWHKQRIIWQQPKMNTTCIWPWLELMCETRFVSPVTDLYRTNWLEENRLVADHVNLSGDPGGTTYEDKWWGGSSWNLAGYRPEYNDYQLSFDYLYSRFWGENGSGMEKILSDLGDYDWWFDATNIYVPYPIKHNYGDILFEEVLNHDSPPDGGNQAAAEWEHPTPAGTWRKVPKWTMGYALTDTDTDPGVTGWMRDKEKGTPDADAGVVDYLTQIHNGAGPDTGEHWAFHSLYANAAPAPAECGNYETNLKDRHGEIHTHDSVYYWEKVYLILNLMIDIIEQLTHIDISGYVSATKYSEYVHTTSDDCQDVLGTHTELMEMYSIEILDHIEEDPNLWTGDVGWLEGWVHFQRQGWDPEDDGSFWTADSADDMIRQDVAWNFVGLKRIVGISEVYVGIQMEDSNQDPASDFYLPLQLVGINDEILTQLDQYEGNVYGWVLVDDIVTTGGFEWLRVWPYNWENIPPIHDGVSPPGSKYFWESAAAKVDIFSWGDLGIIGKIDWDAFPDNIWVRDRTYEKRFLTGVNDTNPPIHEPISFFEKPTVYDANRPTGSNPTACYTWLSYIAEWKLRMDSILMEDAENHGVEYKFDGSGGSGTKKAVDFGVAYQASRKHDIVLDMDIATSPGDAEDLEEAIDNGLKDYWLFTVTAKDNASTYGSGQSDNATNMSEDEEVVAEDGTICPPYGLWDTVPTINGSDVDMSIKEAFGPYGDRTCEYKFTTIDASWTSDWSTDETATHSGGSGAGKTYICYARTVTGQILSIVSSALGAV